MTMRKHSLTFLILCAVAACVLTPAHRLTAQETDLRASNTPMEPVVPQVIRYSGAVPNRAGDTVEALFSIYAAAEGGEPVWSETQRITVGEGGAYSVLLGGASPGGLPQGLFAGGAARWLGVSVERSAEQGRVLLSSVPYAMKSADAESLAGHAASEFVTQGQLAQLALIAGQPGQKGVADPETQPNTSGAVTGSGTNGTIPLWTGALTQGNSEIVQVGADVGINEAAPGATLDVGGTATFRGTTTLPAESTATPSAGFRSQLLDFADSAWSTTTNAPVAQTWRLYVTDSANNSANPTSSFNFQFQNGAGAPTPTILSIGQTGEIAFAPTQTFPGTINSVVGTSPVTATTTSGAVSLGLNASVLETTLNNYYAQLNSTNVFPYFQTFNGGLTTPGTIYANSVNSTTGFVLNGQYFGQGNYALQNSSLGFSTSPSQTGHANLGVGTNSLSSETSGYWNTAVGASAMFSDQDGYDNVAVGTDALTSVVSGWGNVGVGVAAGINLANGYTDTAIGYYAGPDSGSPGLTNATAIGANSTVNENNALVLGQTTTTPGAKHVNVGIGTSAPVSPLDITVDAEGKLGPTITLTNPSLAGGASSSIDFNTTPPVTGTSAYNPGARIAAEDNDYSDNISFYSNTPGAKNNGLRRNMTIYANGDVNVAGNLSKGGGSFKIDHPLDPADKYLYHSFVESPDMMNIYNGVITLDAHGKATVQMPDWFQALNSDFRYQLTAIGAPGPNLFIAEEINGNHFSIAGGKPGMKVSWQVTGIRQDAWANAHRIPVEEEKPANERGYYLHPDLYGAGEDKQVSNAPRQK